MQIRLTTTIILNAENDREASSVIYEALRDSGAVVHITGAYWENEFKPLDKQS